MKLDSPGSPGALHHRNGHDTEIEAALAVHSLTGPRRVEALGHLYRAEGHGLTDDEGGALMGGDRLDFGRRRHELAENGWVAKSTKRRLTPRGKSAVVWVITEAGIRAYERLIQQ